MSKEFLSSPPDFRSVSGVSTPYQAAGQIWDKRIGTSVVQAKNWRLACIVALSTTTLTLSALIVLLSQRQMVPIIVGVDRERGEPVVVGPAENLAYKPQLQEIKFFLSHVVSLVRSVPTDPVLVKQNWLSAYAYLRPAASNLLNDITNKDLNGPLKRIGELSVIIKPITVTQIAAGNSYQIRWQENVYDGHGTMTDQYLMTGIFTVEIESPTDARTLSLNPLGLYITNFQWNREL